MPLPTVKPFFSHDLEVKSRELVPITQSLPFTHVQHVLFLTHQHRCRLLSPQTLLTSSLVSSTCMTHDFFSWKRQRWRRHQPPTPHLLRLNPGSPAVLTHPILLDYIWILYLEARQRVHRNCGKSHSVIRVHTSLLRENIRRKQLMTTQKNICKCKNILVNDHFYSASARNSIHEQKGKAIEHFWSVHNWSSMSTELSWARQRLTHQIEFFETLESGTVVDAPIVQLVTLNSPVPSLSLKC